MQSNFALSSYISFGNKEVYKEMSAAIAISNVSGLACDDISDIKDSVVRVIPNTTPPATYIAGSGTPFPVFMVKYRQPVSGDNPTPITPDGNDWYGRMASIFSTHKEVKEDDSEILHLFFHSEDIHDQEGRWYGIDHVQSIGYHNNYTRIGYMRSEPNAPINITQVPASVLDSSVNPTWKTNPNRNPGPIIESFVSEEEYREEIPLHGLIPPTIPNDITPPPTPTPTKTNEQIIEYYENFAEHGPGARHPWVIERGDYLYLFYDRHLSDRLFDYVRAVNIPYPYTDTAKKCLARYVGGGPTNAAICVARANKQAVYDYNPESPPSEPIWKKYFDPNRTPFPSVLPTPDNDGYTEDSIGGWSSPIIDLLNDSHGYRECPSVTYNWYLEKYTMLTV